MKIKNLFFLTLILYTFIGCYREDDDTKQGCTSNCATIKGKFISLNNEPVSNIIVTLDYHIGGLGGAYSRKIVNTKSNGNGNYFQNFNIKDNEMGQDAQGYFKINIDDSKIDVNKYIRSNNLNENSSTYIAATFNISKRDTIIDNTFYIPKKTYIKINLKNFSPQQNDDYFEVETLYPYGSYVGYNALLDSPYSTGNSGIGNFRAKDIDTKLNVFVAAGEKNIIRVLRRKNGKNTSEDFLMNIPINNTIELTYYY